MADVKKVNFDYIKRWEGGLSSDPRDPAAKSPCPTLTYQGRPLHTNMGVTWAAFHARFPNDPERVFLLMPADKWLQIYHDGYWNFVKGDLINSQAIAELLADWAWGSGAYAAYGLQKCLKANGYPVVIDGMIGPVTVNNLNNWKAVKGERAVFDALYSARTTFLQSLSGFKIYGTGWMNRMRDFKAYAYSIMA